MCGCVGRPGAAPEWLILCLQGPESRGGCHGGVEEPAQENVSKYKYRDLTVCETVNVITLYKDLKPVLDSYVFNDGNSRELMNLTGTIPVPYRNSTYSIPICLWLLDTNPYNPPICFIKPTSSMTIKTGKHVDANGKIYLPYLHEWKHVSINGVL